MPTSRQCRHGTVSRSRGHLSDGLGAAVARHEHAGDGGFGEAVLSRVHVAIVIELDHVGKSLIGGHLTDADEGAIHVQDGFFICLGVAKEQTLEAVVTQDSGHHGGVDEGDVIPLGQDVLQAGLARQEGKVLHHGDVGTALGEEDGFLEGGVATPNDGYGSALVEGSVTDGAVGNALAHELFFALDIQVAVTGAGGDDGGLALVGASFAGDSDVARLAADAGDGVQLDVGAQGQSLLKELFAQLGAAEADIAGVILHAGGVGDLPAEGLLLNEKHALLGSAGVNGGGQPCRTRADDDDVVHIRFSFPVAVLRWFKFGFVGLTEQIKIG